MLEMMVKELRLMFKSCSGFLKLVILLDTSESVVSMNSIHSAGNGVRIKTSSIIKLIVCLLHPSPLSMVFVEP
jgi:hypothetical protein